MRGEPCNIKRTYKESYPLYSLQRLSRYGSLLRIVNEDDKKYLETPDKYIIKESNRDTFYVVEKGLENRLDLISYKFYNNVFLWWAIARMNNIYNPFEIQAGVVLRIPDITHIFSENGVLSNLEE